jgi:hypothetical protein
MPQWGKDCGQITVRVPLITGLRLWNNPTEISMGRYNNYYESGS